MNIVELFAGTKSFANVAVKHGATTFTSDFDASFNTDYTADIMEFDTKRVPFAVDVLWASPPCETFSVASLGHHWTGGKGAYEPKTQACLDGIKRVEKTLEIIDQLQPKVWIIENPRGVLRKLPMMNREGMYRYTVTYCQYGDTRMKPTDLWSNMPNLQLKPMCKNGMPCHVAAPRGSSTGTQGIKTYRDRSRVPSELCKSIYSQVNSKLNKE